MTQMNKELLKQVRDRIAASPQNFDYSVLVNSPNNGNFNEKQELEQLAKNECGTTGCVAGWTMALSPNRRLEYYFSFPEFAQKELGLTSRQARMLFFCDAYGPFQCEAFGNATVEEAIKRIDYLLSLEDGEGE